MPELPDVEALRRHLLSAGLVGRSIAGVDLGWPRAVRRPAPEAFRAGVAGRRIGDIRRRGKYLVLPLGGGPPRTLVLHLGMTGLLRLQPSGRDRPRHTRNVLLLDGGVELCFVDPRKLGALWLVKDAGEVLEGLGPEPLEAAFTPQVLAGQLRDHHAAVKALLCDQAIVAGIGNIYADEVLFMAGIRPLRTGRQLSAKSVQRLHQVIMTRLPEATAQLLPLAGGDGPPTESEEGLEQLLVPRSEGAPCRRCSTPIRRVTVRGRSSYFCPRCQPR